MVPERKKEEKFNGREDKTKRRTFGFCKVDIVHE